MKDKLLHSHSSELSIPEAARPLDPMLTRIKLIGEYFSGAMKSTAPGTKQSKYGFLVGKLLDEAIDEMSEAPPEALHFYMQRIEALMYWGVYGEEGEHFPSDFVMPKELEA